MYTTLNGTITYAIDTILAVFALAGVISHEPGYVSICHWTKLKSTKLDMFQNTNDTKRIKCHRRFPWRLTNGFVVCASLYITVTTSTEIPLHRSAAQSICRTFCPAETDNPSRWTVQFFIIPLSCQDFAVLWNSTEILMHKSQRLPILASFH